MRFVFAVWCGLAVLPVSATEVAIFAPGAPDSLQNALRSASLSLSLSESEDQTTQAQDLLAAARADYARLLSALYENGFYSGVINIRVDGREAADISPVQAPPSITQIVIQVQPGPRFAFSRASIEPRAPTSSVPEEFAPGQEARGTVIVRAARAAVSDWRDASHAKAQITAQKLVANHPAGTLSADILIDPGPALRFGDLRIERDGGVRPARVAQIVALPTGEPFSPEELRDANDRLRRTGAFSSAILAEDETPSPDGTLDIIATLDAAKPRRIGFGGEIESLEGASVSAFWLHRNLLGGGERLRFEGEVSGIGSVETDDGIDFGVQTRYERPSTFSPETDLYVGARIERNDEPDFLETFARIGAGVIHRFSDTLTGEAGVAYQYSEIEDALGDRTLQHIFFPGRLIWDLRNDPLDATQGIYANAEFMPFVGLDDASDSGAALFADLRGYRRLGESSRFVLAGRAQIGSIIGASASGVPASLLFFSGGAGTVRGQPFQDLGVELPNGEQIGGRSFLGFSGEVRANISGPWGVVGFVDTGFVGADSFGTDNGDWHSGAGLGVRYKTGLGPIRFDLAVPVDGDSDRGVEFYIGIGQAF
ncbi:MAG: autotransporter assembly complex family protein [Pseudomonadota bacterium]